MMTTSRLIEHAEAIRASDADRDRALGLLRDHWLAGRLTLDEYEERCDEAARGRYLDDLRHAIRELPYPLPEHGAPARTAPPPTATHPPDRPPTQAGAIAAVVLGALSLLGVVGSFGILAFMTLPTSAWAWTLGRRARRQGGAEVRVVGAVGEVLGVVATVLGCLALSACAIIIGSA